MARRRVERHVWQDALDGVIALTKSEKGRRIYGWRKETIERSFAEAKKTTAFAMPACSESGTCANNPS